MYRVITRSGVSWFRIIYSLLALLSAGVTAYFSSSFPSEVWDKAPGMICNAYSILTGFFLAVLTMSGTFDTALSTLSAPALRSYKGTFTRRLERQALGCLSCLITVILSIGLEIGIPSGVEELIRWAFTAMTVISLFWAMSLPCALYSFYKERYEYMIEQKRLMEGQQTR